MLRVAPARMYDVIYDDFVSCVICHVFAASEIRAFAFLVLGSSVLDNATHLDVMRAEVSMFM